MIPPSPASWQREQWSFLYLNNTKGEVICNGADAESGEARYSQENPKTCDFFLSCYSRAGNERNPMFFTFLFVTHKTISKLCPPLPPKQHHHNLYTTSSSSIIYYHQDFIPNQAPPICSLTPSHRKIVNFIINNGNNWDTLCCPHSKKSCDKSPHPCGKPSKHKIAKSKSHLTIKSLLKENTHCFMLFPIHHVGIRRMYKKTSAYFWTVEDLPLGQPPGPEEIVPNQTTF
jgi:hypothetical protein